MISSKEAGTITLKVNTKPEFRPSRPRKNGKGDTKPVIMLAEMGNGYGGVPTGLVDDKGRAIKAQIKLYVSVEENKPVSSGVGSIEIG